MTLLAFASAATSQPTADWRDVEKALGRAGDERDAVYRVTFPRSDLPVRVGSVAVRTGLALTSWAAFQRSRDATMVMGDLVLSANEVNPAVTRLTAGGIHITAIHNHVLDEQPRVMYVHFHGFGDASRLARTLREALAATATPLALTRPAMPEKPDVPSQFDAFSRVFGRQGTARNGVLGFNIPRAEKITAHGASLGPRMGVGIVINVQAESSGVVATGDYVLVADEVQVVIRTLREHGIAVTSLHNHMLDDEPRLFFLHFWGRGTVEGVARGLRAALEKTNHRKD